MSPRPCLLQWVPASAALLGVGAVGVAALPQLSWAQTQAEQPQIDTALFDGLLADLRAGNRQAAINRISLVESLSGQPMLVSNRGQFVDRLLGCSGTITNRRNMGGMPLIDAEWQCADGVITARLGSVMSARYIEVVDFADQAERDRRAARPTIMLSPPPPAPPIRTREMTPEERTAAEVRDRLLAVEQAQVLDTLGVTLQAGSLDGVEGSINEYTRFTYGYRDPFNSVNVNDLQGRGIGAGREQVAAAIAHLGTPTSYSCEPGQINVCRWTFAEPQRGLLAFVSLGGSRIFSVQLIYITPEALALAAQNATPEQIEAFVASQQAGGAN